ncbi:hypothetical protein C7A17_12455 [Ectopseudomonas mendocina]|uniref:DUF2790 domain-containing protein n=1 Tax=Ectopseudomonas mendocina TaxID=300 RepID=A0A2R3QP33_ECTME|nr:hypothetical protein C7A17_12455 [Pseudomonas mendocina]
MLRLVISKHIVISIILCLGAFYSAAYAAEEEPVRMLIKKYGTDTYSTMDDLLYIRTYKCLEPAYSENAVLFYVPYSDDNKLLFSNQVECKVTEVYDRGAHYSREGR